MPTTYGSGLYGEGLYGLLGPEPADPGEPTPEAPPDLAGTLANRLYEMLAPLAYADAENDWALLKICEALIGRGQELEDLVRDTDDVPGWGALVDPDLAPAKALPFVAQLVGVRLPKGISEAEQRERILAASGFQRGTLAALIAAAQLGLTGTKTVFVNERQGSPYALGVTTWESETPDEAATLARLLEQKPAGIVMTYSTIVGGDYQTLRATHTDYADVAGEFTDYADVRTDPSQT